MLGDTSFRVLFQVLGYVYPAYLCYKDVQRNATDKLRLWCMYWVLMAAFTAVQPIADTFLFFIPLYYSAKLAFACYLWASNLQGAELVYTRYVQPFVARHEPMVDAKLAEARAMISDHASQQMKNAVEWARTRGSVLLFQWADKARQFMAQAQPPQRADSLRADQTGQAAPAAERSGSFSSAMSDSFRRTSSKAE